MDGTLVIRHEFDYSSPLWVLVAGRNGRGRLCVGREVVWWEETRAGIGPKGHRCSLPLIFASVSCQIELGKLFLSMSAEECGVVLQQQVDARKLWKVLHMYMLRIFAPAQRIADSHDHTTRPNIKAHGSN